MNIILRKFTLSVLCFVFAAAVKTQAQCLPILKNVYDTLCSGDSLFGYHTTGIYKDTFRLANGCDSVRTLNLTVIPKVGSGPAPAWFNTGTDGLGGRLPAGSQDLNWKLGYSLNGPYAPAYVMRNPPGSYAVSPWPDCAWISHSAAGDHTGNVDFFYKIEFDLPCFDACGASFNKDSTFCLSLDFLADNAVVEVYINGKPQSSKLGGVIPPANPYYHVGYQMANSASFSLCDDWTSGHNSLVIKVASGANYAAFLAQASVKIPTPKPTVSDFASANASAGGVDSACAPYLAQFSNKSVSANQFIWDFGDGSPKDTSKNPQHRYASPGVYQVTLYASSDSSCALPDTSSLTIVVLGDTLRTAQRDTASCFATMMTLNAGNTSANNFIWDNNSSGAERNIDSSGLYWVKYPIGKCDLRIDTFHAWFPKGILPEVDSLMSCKSENNGSAWINIHPNDPNNYSIFWRKVGDTSVLSQSDSLKNVVAGLYRVQLVSDRGCDTSLIVSIPEDEGLRLSFTPIDTIVCMGDLISFKNTSNSTAPSYLWDFGDYTQFRGRDGAHSFEKPGTFLVTLRDESNARCSDTAFGKVTVDSAITQIRFDMDKDSLCTGEKITFTPFLDSRALTVLWSFGDGTFHSSDATSQVQHAFEEAGAYLVSLTADFRACPPINYRDTIKVSPFPKVDLGPDTTMCLNAGVLTLLNRSNNPSGMDLSHLWNNGDTTKALRVTHPGVYALTLTDKSSGCASTEQIAVEKDCYIDIPNAFSPDGDGANDYFLPRGLLSKNVQRFHMQIFNRWGQLIFETDKIDGRGWDGKFNNVPQPHGVFIYQIEAEFPGNRVEKYQGNVTLLR